MRKKDISVVFVKSLFSTNGNLKVHMITHLGEMSYQCSVCRRSSSTNNKLKVHMMTHTGEKPHQCTTFDKYCTTMSNLNTHTC